MKPNGPVGTSDPGAAPPWGLPSLEAMLKGLEGTPYPAYRSLRGLHPLGARLELEFLAIQPDPFAPPSRLRLTVPRDVVGLDGDALRTDAALLAAEDFLARAVDRWLRGERATNAVVRCDSVAQQILRHSMVRLAAERVEILLFAHLPARGRRIEGRRAAEAIAAGIPRMVREALMRGAWDRAALARHVAAIEDHRALTRILDERGWVAFVADGSRLARRSGEEDLPLDSGNVPFAAPDGFAREVELPHAGRIRGLAIPHGITLLCGGGFHGKSTLLRALAAAVYPHIPGDGRERVCTDPTAMGIRAEDGRSVTDVDLRPFITRLPDGRDVASFRTTNASGSTSQAAGIIEALEAGCRCLLIDEDTSATNFLLRDPWMAKLLRPEQEPIVPLLSRLREIGERFGASTVLCVGGSGEAFRVADRVIVMDSYRPFDGGGQVAEIRAEMGEGLKVPAAAWPEPGRDLDLRLLRERRTRVRALSARRLLVGRSEIDLSASGALLHPSQARALAAILGERMTNGGDTVRLPDFAFSAARRMALEGPLIYPGPATRGDLCEVRAQEIALMMNRLRVDNETGGRGMIEGEPRRGAGTMSTEGT